MKQAEKEARKATAKEITAILLEKESTAPTVQRFAVLTFEEVEAIVQAMGLEPKDAKVFWDRAKGDR